MTASQTNSQNIFLINRSDLIGRFDAPVYRKSFYFTSKKYKSVKLSEIAFVNPNTSFDELNAENEITFIPMEAIDETLGAVSEYQIKKVKSSNGFTRFKENDLIWAKITPCMQNGKSAIVTQTLNGYACGSTEFYIIRPKSNNVLVSYLHFILRDNRILESAKNYFGGSAGQQRVAKEFLLNLKLPLPDLTTQSEIVKRITSAYDEKKNKEQQAADLLTSIDTYILSELGVTLPKEISGISSRIFTANFSDVMGARLDPFHNQISFTKTIDAIHKGKYKVETLKHLIIDLKNGVEIRDYVEQGGVRYLRVTDLDKTGLNHASPRYVSEQDVPEKIKLNKDCLLISRSGSLGLVNVVESEIENSILSSHIFKVELRTDKILPHYLVAYLRSPLGQSEIFRNNNGGVIPEINQQALKSIFVPVPSIEVQKEILKHINDIHKQIKKLQSDAIQILENAKHEVETMIID